MNSDEQRKITDRLSLLLNIKIESGCMPGEVEVAAYKIGSLVQKHGLHVAFPLGSTNQREEEDQHRWREKEQQSRHRSSINFEYGEVTVIGATEKALFLHDDENERDFWLPRSQCRDGCQHWERGDNGVLFVSQWWAEKEGWM